MTQTRRVSCSKCCIQLPKDHSGVCPRCESPVCVHIAINEQIGIHERRACMKYNWIMLVILIILNVAALVANHLLPALLCDVYFALHIAIKRALPPAWKQSHTQ